MDCDNCNHSHNAHLYVLTDGRRLVGGCTEQIHMRFAEHGRNCGCPCYRASARPAERRMSHAQQHRRIAGEEDKPLYADHYRGHAGR